ncbi:hypothetical protein CpipJ_CPIJ007392 [Culex quinquefasciatus]|uniref:Uncharacterized protein n=1 Tax=Culex quinquefasciatus TaxID=7176 RepID=B0WJF6_CULQU|nr:hypothetical protein CpipJ_CPIJ007392 [Culex quinquefasciatus]|eukprot:XP_001848840.1 hypothetical protein CpipJ_CPIJ007392 [Culex quinquefasciatus]
MDLTGTQWTPTSSQSSDPTLEGGAGKSGT